MSKYSPEFQARLLAGLDDVKKNYDAIDALISILEKRAEESRKIVADLYRQLNDVARRALAVARSQEGQAEPAAPLLAASSLEKSSDK